VPLPSALKSILRQKKNYANSNISPCKNIIFKKSSKRTQNPSRYNSITNLKFGYKPKYHLSKILI
jgi:predicted translin family RNA/ssDNA-binding protein